MVCTGIAKKFSGPVSQIFKHGKRPHAAKFGPLGGFSRVSVGAIIVIWNVKWVNVLTDVSLVERIGHDEEDLKEVADQKSEKFGIDFDGAAKEIVRRSLAVRL